MLESLVGPDNPYFNAGFGMVVVGTGLAMLRQGSRHLWELTQRRLLVTMEVTSKDPAFHWVLRWVNNHCGTRRLSLQTTKKETASGKSSTTFNFVPSTGNHFMKYADRWFMIERARELEARDLNSGTPWESIKFTTVGTDPSIYEELLEDAKHMAEQRDAEHTLIYTSWGMQGWKPFGDPRRRRPLSSVVLDQDISQNILQDVGHFLDRKEWYIERGIPYRRGYMLHGPPGSGKSSFVQALAGEIGYDICVLSMTSTGLSDEWVAQSLLAVPERSIVLLEDVDAAFVDRSANPNAVGVTFSGFLNALDGATAGEERMLFMTTNHIDRLDRALYRPGRVDQIHYLGPASSIQLAAMFRRFYPESGWELGDAFAAKVAGNDISMAELQGYFMMNKERPDLAFHDADAFVEGIALGRQGIHTPEDQIEYDQSVFREK